MIKVKVRETGQVICVVFHDRIRTIDGETEVWRDLRGHNLYKTSALDFQNLDSSEEDVKEKSLSEDWDYIEKLRHQYMGQATQALIRSGAFDVADKHDVSMVLIARKAWGMADALIYEIFKDRRPKTSEISDVGNCCEEY